MGSVDQPLLHPRDWKVVWGERLDGDDRRRIKRTAYGGDVMVHPDEAAVAAEYAIRSARGLRAFAVLAAVIGVALLMLLLVAKPENPNMTFWYQLALALAWAILVPGLAIWRIRRLLTAYSENRQRSEAGDAVPDFA